MKIDLLLHNKELQLLVMFIVLDVVFGVLRAIKERSINSTIGIDGIIRKVGMLITIIICVYIDVIVGIDLISFVPVEVKTFLNIETIGISSLFNLLYVIFELLSIFKNMVRCNLPMPKRLHKILEDILDKFTNENNKEQI